VFSIGLEGAFKKLIKAYANERPLFSVFFRKLCKSILLKIKENIDLENVFLYNNYIRKRFLDILLPIAEKICQLNWKI
jgi:hypothetical protein